MSPTITDLAKDLKRNIQKGDILIQGVGYNTRYFEVEEFGIPLKKGLSEKIFGTLPPIGIRVRELTPYGPSLVTKVFAISGGEGYSNFRDLVPVEKRTDGSRGKERGK